jgi:hypothetical protein
MATHYSPKIVTDGLVLCLDATNSKSYPGTGTSWRDISGNSNHFTINASAFTSNSAGKYMDFNGTYGLAVTTSGVDVPGLSDAAGVTYHIVTRIKNSTAEWRTLTRSAVNDHHIIIQSGGWDIGMYDNDSAGFLGTGFSQQSLPGYGTSAWISMYWRWQSVSPYYQFSYNDTPDTARGTLTSVNSRYNRGFWALGGINNSQYWGDIAMFNVYARSLSNAELLQNYNATKKRFAL